MCDLKQGANLHNSVSLGCTFEGVKSFTILGVDLSNAKHTSQEINNTVIAGNREYRESMILKATVISRMDKMKHYKTLVRPVITNESET